MVVQISFGRRVGSNPNSVTRYTGPVRIRNLFPDTGTNSSLRFVCSLSFFHNCFGRGFESHFSHQKDYIFHTPDRVHSIQTLFPDTSTNSRLCSVKIWIKVTDNFAFWKGCHGEDAIAWGKDVMRVEFLGLHFSPIMFAQNGRSVSLWQILYICSKIIWNR